jgi:hypothetical protein
MTKPNEFPAKNDYREMVEEPIVVIQKHLFYPQESTSSNQNIGKWDFMEITSEGLGKLSSIHASFPRYPILSKS